LEREDPFGVALAEVPEESFVLLPAARDLPAADDFARDSEDPVAALDPDLRRAEDFCLTSVMVPVESTVVTMSGAEVLSLAATGLMEGRGRGMVMGRP
jgi:hypothetical protein